MKIYKTQMPEITLKYKQNNHFKVKITTSDDAFKTLVTLYNKDTIDYIESSFVLFLNRRNITIGWMKISEGGTCSTVIDVKVLYATALKCGASAIVVSHNHPSGEHLPSESDHYITNKIKQAGKLLDIELLDHVIVTEQGYFSFADRGEL